MNKKHLIAPAMAALASAGFFAAQASASLLIYEPFSSSPTTPITGTSPQTPASETWVQAGTVGSTVHQIGSPGLTGGPLASSGNMGDLKAADNGEFERLNIPNAFNTDLTPKYGANSSLYYSLLLNVPSITGLTVPHTNANANNDLIIAFNNSQGSQATRPNSWNGELSIRLGSTAGTYNLGVRGSTTTAGTTYWTGDLAPGNTHFVVVQAQLGTSPGTAANDNNSLWLDPSSGLGNDELTRPAPDGSSNGAASNTDANNSMQSLLIGAGISSGSNPNDVYVDEIRVGDTWADVTSVPEPATIGLLGIGALGLLRRRRRTA